MAETKPYGLEGDFEVVLIAAICERERLYARVGDYLDPDGLDYSATKLALRAAKSISMETGNGPKSQILVLQRLRRWLDDGKITKEEIDGLNWVGRVLEAIRKKGPTHKNYANAAAAARALNELGQFCQRVDQTGHALMTTCQALSDMLEGDAASSERTGLDFAEYKMVMQEKGEA